MKHKSIDLASEVKRATLPDGLEGFLFPLYEAVSNSFHSLEERWGDDVEEKGHIEIEFDVDGQEILIADNGVGFDDKNLGAFLTPLTGNKYERGGRASEDLSRSKSSRRSSTLLGRPVQTAGLLAALIDMSRSQPMIILSRFPRT